MTAYLSTLHAIRQIEARDVPAPKDDVIGVDHREKLVKAYIDLLSFEVADPAG